MAMTVTGAFVWATFVPEKFEPKKFDKNVKLGLWEPSQWVTFTFKYEQQEPAPYKKFG